MTVVLGVIKGRATAPIPPLHKLVFPSCHLLPADHHALSFQWASGAGIQKWPLSQYDDFQKVTEMISLVFKNNLLLK